MCISGIVIHLSEAKGVQFPVEAGAQQTHFNVPTKINQLTFLIISKLMKIRLSEAKGKKLITIYNSKHHQFSYSLRNIIARIPQKSTNFF